MTSQHFSHRRLSGACLTLIVAAFAPVSLRAEEVAPARDDLARLIVSQLKGRKGLALDVGCGDASLALAVARRSELVVECVEADDAVVDRARSRIDAGGLYGTRVTASRGDFGRLDYPDACASLVLCGDEFVAGRRGRDLREVYRVLSPNGVAWIGQSGCIAKAGQVLTRPVLEKWLAEARILSYTIVEKQGIWARITRPRSPGWDEWTHRSHDPSNTFGSEDTVAGLDFKAHWVSDYRPGLSSAAVAAAGGRLVFASLSYDKFPDTTPHIQVLDAFTGIEQWARVGKQQLPIDRPPTLYSNRESCSDIAVVGDQLYLLGGKFCHVFDLATGKTLSSLPIPPEAKPGPDDAWLYLACVGDLLYGAVGKAPGVKIDWNTMHYRGVAHAVFALERTTGKLRWAHHAAAATCSLCIGGDRFYFCEGARTLHALDARTGKSVWTSPLAYPEGTEVAGLSLYRDKLWLLYNQPRKDKSGRDLNAALLLTVGHNQRELDAYGTADGKFLFNTPFGAKVAGVSFAGGLVFGTGQHGGEGISVVEADTGAFRWKTRENLKCTPSLATPNLFLSQRQACPSILDLRGISLEGPTKEQRVSFTGFRPSCSYPGLPANGMIYQQAEGCACASPIRGNIAFIPGKPALFQAQERLVPGIAFADPADSRPAWATWRADHQRSARTSETAAESLELLWTAQLSGDLTPLAVGDGMVHTASTDRKVYALDAATGKVRWQRIAAGRVPAGPFLWRGRLFYTDDDGWAACLCADNGEAVWRFRAARGPDRIVGYGNFMSRWPARTGVLVHDDTAYFGAGFFPDEGTVVYAVDARTGTPRWEKLLDSDHKGGRTAGFVPDGAMALAEGRLFIPSASGMPWQIDLADPEHKASFTKGVHISGRQIVTAGNDLVAITPGLQYVHHVHYKGVDPNVKLPVVTDDTLYLLNQPLRTQRFLMAARRDAFQLSQSRTAMYVPRKDAGVPVEQTWRWKAWKDEPMEVVLATANVLFTAGNGKVFATRLADGKELWSAPLPGDARDLAFHDGRLFVQCGPATVVCFVAKAS